MSEAPFVGPQPFGEQDVIWGRGAEISELRYLVGAKRIVVLHSPSGAGKSSLLRARNGLLNRLRESGRFEVWGPARVHQPPEQLTVANRFAWSAINDFEQSRNEGVRPAAAFASTDLASYIRDRAPARNPLLVFDQFEEVLRIEPALGKPKVEFFEQLGQALYDPSVWALFVIREDYLAALRPYARMIPTHLQHRYRINFLRRKDQALEAVRAPLEQLHRRFEEGAAEAMLTSLATNKILDGNRYVETVGDYVEPLQIQLVCADLWPRIRDRNVATPIRLKDFGDLNKALGDYYASKVKREDRETERRIRDWFDKKLIGPDGVRNLVRKEPQETAGLSNVEIENLVVHSYLVRQEPRTGSMWFELSHDRLLEPIRTNNQQWFEGTLTLLQQSSALWDARGRPDNLLLLGKRLKKAKAEVVKKAIELSSLDSDYMRVCNSMQEALEHDKKFRVVKHGCLTYFLIWLFATMFNVVESLTGARALGVIVPCTLIYFAWRWWSTAERR